MEFLESSKRVSMMRAAGVNGLTYKTELLMCLMSSSKLSTCSAIEEEKWCHALGKRS